MTERLVGLLRQNARRSVSDLALELGVSRATVKAHMERLERSGEIQGYTVVLRADAAEPPVRGVMMIEIEGHAAERVSKVLKGFTAVRAIHMTHGRWDVVVDIGTDTLEAFDDILRRIRLIPAVTASETTLLLSTIRSVG